MVVSVGQHPARIGLDLRSVKYGSLTRTKYLKYLNAINEIKWPISCVSSLPGFGITSQVVVVERRILAPINRKSSQRVFSTTTHRFLGDFGVDCLQDRPTSV